VSMERQTVRLEGGPLDGQERQIHPDSRHYFEEWDGGPAEHWPPPARKRECATYRRVDETTFVFAPTQTAMGVPNPDFYKEEPEMSETVTPEQPDPLRDPLAPAQPVPPVQEPEPDTTEEETEETTEETTEEGEVEF